MAIKVDKILNKIRELDSVVGPAGAGITDITYNLDGTLTITYGSTGDTVITGDLHGLDGDDGREIELQTSATHIQRRYVGDVSRTDLVLLSDLKGADGDDGVGIVSTIKTGTVGLVDTYTITYTDSSTSTFDITNGANGTDGDDGVSFVPKGAYSAGTAYVLNDVVSYLGSSWIALQNTTGNTPSEGVYWTLCAAKGADGTGSGDVMGPSTNTDSYIPQWSGTDSKTLKNGLAVPAGGLAGLTALGGKVDSNTAITGATKTKITYDAKGLVTAGADATTADIADSTDKRYVTDAQLSALHGVNDANTTSNSYADGKVEDSIVDGHTTIAPSGNAVFDALALKAPAASPTFTTKMTGSFLTASEMLVTNASKEIVSAPVATYPSLAELAYVKGVTSAIQTQIGGKVDKSTYDAHSILAATTDDTPAAVTVAEQTVVGRITGGNIKALSTTEIRTLINVADGATANAKASSSDIDTGSDDTKFATAKAIADSKLSFIDGTETLTNKRITKRVYNTTSTATLTPEISTYDVFELTAQAADLTIANHSTSTPSAGDKITIRVKDNGTARAISYGNMYRGMGASILPVKTIKNQTLYLEFMWNAADSKRDLVNNYGVKSLMIAVIDNATALATGDGKWVFPIPAELNGMNLVSAEAYVDTVSSSGAPSVMIRNVTDSQDMLSTAITIDASEYNSYTAATRSVVNTSYDDVATGDRIAIDVDGAGTGTKGLQVILGFQMP